MAYKIVWTNEAAISFQASLDYLESRFTSKEIIRFINAANEKIKLIEFDPFMYRKSSRFQSLRYTNVLGKSFVSLRG